MDMDFEKLIKEAQAGFDESLKEAKELSKLDSVTVVDLLLKKYDELKMSDWKGLRREPASEEEVNSAEKKLSIKMPDSAKIFYSSVNGIENVGGELPFSMYRVQELDYGKNSSPTISTAIKLTQERYEQNIGEDVQVMNVLSTEDLMSTLSGSYMTKITLKEADEFLLISSCKGHTVGLCVKEINGIVPGNVLGFEGSSGTFYENINHWLANGIQ